MIFTTDGLLVCRELTSTVNLSHQQYQAKADAKNKLRKEKPKKSRKLDNYMIMGTIKIQNSKRLVAHYCKLNKVLLLQMRL